MTRARAYMSFGRLVGPLRAVIHSPDLARHWSRLGEYLRFLKASQHREMPSNAVAALLLSGRNRQRRFPGTTLMMHGAPALVLAQHRGRNLRFKGSPLQAALEQLPTPMPFTTGSFRACAPSSRAADNGIHQLTAE